MLPHRTSSFAGSPCSTQRPGIGRLGAVVRPTAWLPRFCRPCSTHMAVKPVALLTVPSSLHKHPAADSRSCSSNSRLQGTITEPCSSSGSGSRTCRSRASSHSSSRGVKYNSVQSSRVSTASSTAADLAQLLDSQDQGQQLQGLHKLLQQQQAAIATLQQQVQQLQQLQAAAAASGAGNGSSGVAQGSQQPPLPLYVGSYKTMTLEDFRALPDKIIMVRHAESQGNVDARTYSSTPDYEVPLSARGWEQAVTCGSEIRSLMEQEHGKNYKLFFMTSPYCRTRQTFVGVRQAFPDVNFAGVQEEVQLREQDFGNFQNPEKIKSDLAERNRFGRFYYRFPDGESGSDVYNRISIFEDHLIRDMKAGKFSSSTSLCLVTHGLTMRVFLMRWFNWTVESFLQVYNPPNAKSIIVEKMSEEEFVCNTSKLRDRRQTLQVKNAYRLRKDSMARLKMSPTATMENIDLIGQTYMA